MADFWTNNCFRFIDGG